MTHLVIWLVDVERSNDRLNYWVVKKIYKYLRSAILSRRILVTNLFKTVIFHNQRIKIQSSDRKYLKTTQKMTFLGQNIYENGEITPALAKMAEIGNIRNTSYEQEIEFILCVYQRSFAKNHLLLCDFSVNKHTSKSF